MHRPVLLAALAGALVLPAAAMAAPCSDQLEGVNDRCAAWTGAYNHAGGRAGDGEDIGRAVVASPTGDRVFVTGQSRDDGTVQDQATAAFQVGTGQLLWSARADQAGSFDTGSAIAVDPAGERVFVTGRSTNEGFDWLTTAYDAGDGQKLWTALLQGDKEVDDTPFGVVSSPDGQTVYVTGGVDDGSGIPGDAVVVAYDSATGEERWSGRFDGGRYDGSLRVDVSPDGSRVYMLGTTRGATSGNDYLVAAFEASDPERLGDLVWASTYDSGAGFDDPAGFDQSEDGSTIVVTGTSAGSGNTDFATVAIDTEDGSRMWSARYDSTRNGNDTAGGVVVSGGVAVMTGAAAEGVAGFDYFTRGYDLATGSVKWTAIENSVAHFADRATTISGNATQVFVSGYTVVPRGEIQPVYKIEPGTVMTVSYDADTGAREWIAHHNQSGVGADVAVAGTMSPNGQTYYWAGTFVFTGVYVYPVVAAKPYAYDFGVVAYTA